MKNLFFIFSVLFYSIDARYECHNETIVKTVLPIVDFLFLLDSSASMCSNIDAVKSGFKVFANEIGKNNVNARFAVAIFGGMPKILLPFQKDYAAFENSIGSIVCGTGACEASFEAIRMALPPLNGQHMALNCLSTFGGKSDRSKCNLNWNSTAVKVIVHVTDEDSDCPIHPLYQMKNQMNESGCMFQYDKNGNPPNRGNCFEPLFTPRLLMRRSDHYTYFRNGSNLALEKSYQDEIDVTADELAKSGVFLLSLIRIPPGAEHAISTFNEKYNWFFKTNYVSKNLIPDEVAVTTAQFGHPNFQSQTNLFTEFNIPQTIQNLEENGFKNSLQAQVLSKGGIMRVFDLASFVSASNRGQLLTAFYTELVKKVVEIQQNCVLVSDTLSTTKTKSTTRSRSTSTTTSKTKNSTSTSPFETSITTTESELCFLEIDPTCGKTIVSITQVATPPDKKSENNEQKTEVSGFAAIVSSGVLIAGISGILVLRKMRKNQALTFRQMFSESDKGVVNPLYKSYVSGENPLYEGQGARNDDILEA
jgi:hypothetical protein